MASPEPLVTDPLAPIEPLASQGAVVALGVPNSQDYPRLVFGAPYHTLVAIADIIQPSVLEAVQGILPTLVPPYVNQAAIDAVNALAVRRVGDTMTGPLNLSPTIPTQPTMAATKSYVDTIVATVVPEVPPVPAGQTWGRQTGQWTPLGVGGTVTNIATGAGLTGGPITGTGTISMASMAGLTLKGNNSASVAAPADLTVAQTMTMLGAAPLNSPTFGGTPSLPTGTIAITQPPTTNNTTVATTAFVASAVATGTAGFAPLANPVFTGDPQAPTPATADSDTSIATTAFVKAQSYLTTPAAASTYLPLAGGNVTGNLNASGNVGIGTTGPGAKLDVVGAIRATGYVGTTTNDNALAGQVGEVISAVNGTPAAVATTTTITIASINLTPGDWDVMGDVWIQFGSVGPAAIGAGLHTVAATMPPFPSVATTQTYLQIIGSTFGFATLPLSSVRASLATTTTYYVVATQTGGTGTTAMGKIWARRAR